MKKRKKVFQKIVFLLFDNTHAVGSADRGKRWAGRDFSVPRAAGTHDIIGGAYNMINYGAGDGKIPPDSSFAAVGGTNRVCIMKMTKLQNNKIV